MQRLEQVLKFTETATEAQCTTALAAFTKRLVLLDKDKYRVCAQCSKLLPENEAGNFCDKQCRAKAYS